MTPPARDTHSFNGSPMRAVGFLVVGLMLACAARPALAWHDPSRRLIIEEAVRRLPKPLRGLCDGPAHLDRLQEAAAPDEGAEVPISPYGSDANPSRVFRVDAGGGEPPAFADIPRDRSEAKTALGEETIRQMGTAPWAAADALDRLSHALTEGRTDAVFDSAGDLARAVTDCHMPLHTTTNHDGAQTGNHGVGGVVATGLMHRRLEVYHQDLRQKRRCTHYVPHPTDRLFGWLAKAHSRVSPILKADAAARQRATYNPAQHPEHLTAPETAKPYYEALVTELERHGSPVTSSLRDAADHLADLLYTAWVRAGKPLELHPTPEADQETAAPPYWLLVLAAVMLLVLFLPRLRERREKENKGDTGSDAS